MLMGKDSEMGAFANITVGIVGAFIGDLYLINRSIWCYRI